MNIDYLYEQQSNNNGEKKEGGVSKDNFYLGMVSQVFRENAYVQVENLSLLSHRNIRLESLVPNTINYFVIIDSIQGLFIAEIYQSKVKSTESVHISMNQGNKDDIYPEMALNVIGVLDGNKFKLPGLSTVGITDKVYIANEEIILMYLNSIEINDYKTIDDNGKKVKQKKLSNLMKLGYFDNKYLSLQPNTLFDHHLMVVGTTNSGKSTSSLTILDRLISSGKKVLIIDPTGEYQNSFNDDEVDKLILGMDTSLSTENVDDSFWIDFFNVSSDEDSNKASVLSNAIYSLRYQKYCGNKEPLVKDGKSSSELLDSINSISSKQFDLKLLPEQIKNEAVKEKDHKFKSDGNLFNASIWLIQKVQYFLRSSLIKDFFNVGKSNLFEEIDKFIKPKTKKSMYLNLSKISKTDNTSKTIIDLISKHIINNYPDDKEISIILFIDEVHRYINRYIEESGLISIAREGRKKGVFLFLTTQNPKDVPNVLSGQIGTMIIHRLTHSEEIMAVQNQVDQNTISQINKLNQGEAILTSVNLIKDVHVYFVKSNRSHDNDTPLI